MFTIQWGGVWKRYMFESKLQVLEYINSCHYVLQLTMSFHTALRNIDKNIQYSSYLNLQHWNKIAWILKLLTYMCCCKEFAFHEILARFKWNLRIIINHYPYQKFRYKIINFTASKQNSVNIKTFNVYVFLPVAFHDIWQGLNKI